MKSEVTWRFELSGGIRTSKFICHSRVNSGEEAHSDEKDKHGVDEADGGAEPPVDDPTCQECLDVDQGKEPAVDQVDKDANPFCLIAIRREHGSEHERQIHASQAETARSAQERSQNNRSGKSPQNCVAKVHAALF